MVDGWIGLDSLIGCGSVRSVPVDLFEREREREILWLIDGWIELVDWLGINSMCSSRFVRARYFVVD